jgi:hypothetical protein
MRGLLMAAIAVAGCGAPAAAAYDPVLPFDAGANAVDGFVIAVNMGDAGSDRKVRDFLAAQGFDARAVFAAALQAELGALGYAVSVGDGAGGPTGQGAVLKADVTRHGFQQVGGAWRPAVFASVTAMSASGDVLLRDRVSFGDVVAPAFAHAPLGEDVVILPDDPANSFRDIDAIVAGDPARPVAALRVALEATAKGVARLVGASLTAEAPAAPDAGVAPVPVMGPPSSAEPVSGPAAPPPATDPPPADVAPVPVD